MRTPIPDQLRQAQQWGQTVDGREAFKGRQQIARVALPDAYQRVWTINLAPLVPAAWTPGPGAVAPPFQADGVYAEIIYGSRTPQKRLIDWPLLGGQYAVRGSNVALNVVADGTIAKANLPPAVSGEIIDAELEGGHYARCPTFTESAFQVLALAAGSLGQIHAMPLGAIAARYLCQTFGTPQATPSGSVVFNMFDTVGGVWMMGSNIETSWLTWDNFQSSSLAGFGEFYALRPVRGIASAVASNYKMQYRIDL